MPQMSPMNWMILSTLFFFLTSLVFSITNSSNKHNIYLSNKIKTMKWKW